MYKLVAKLNAMYIQVIDLFKPLKIYKYKIFFSYGFGIVVDSYDIYKNNNVKTLFFSKYFRYFRMSKAEWKYSRLKY